MILDHLPPLADIFGVNPGHLIAIVIPVAAMVLGGVIAITAMYFKHQQRRLWHDMARTALEKGQPIPDYPGGRDRSPGSGSGAELREHDIRGGLVLIAVGFGLFYFFTAVVGGKFGYVGAIPGFIGVALLLNGLFTQSQRRRQQPPTDRPPQS